MNISEAKEKLEKKKETDKKKKDTENALKHGTFKSPQQPKLDRSVDVREPNAFDSRKLKSPNEIKRIKEKTERKNKAYQSAIHQVKGEVAKRLYETTDKKTLTIRRRNARDKGRKNPNSTFINTKAHDIVNKQFYPKETKEKVYHNKGTTGYTQVKDKDGNIHKLKVTTKPTNFKATDLEMSRIKQKLHDDKPERRSDNTLSTNAQVVSKFHKANNPVIKEDNTPKVKEKKSTPKKTTTKKSSNTKKSTKVKANTKNIKW